MSSTKVLTYKNLLIWWLAISVSWGIYRLFELPEFFSEVVAKPVIWIGATCLFLGMGLIPKKVLDDLKNSYSTTRPFWKIFLLPSLFIAVYFYLINFRQVVVPDFSYTLVATGLIINFATAVVEEIVYRGFLYVWLLQKTNEIVSFLVVQVLFLLAHVPILAMSSGTVMETVTRVVFILIMGAIHTTVFRVTKSIYASSLTHGIWNSLVYYFLLVG